MLIKGTVPRGKWLCVLCHSKSPDNKKKSAGKKAVNREPRISESESTTAANSAKETKETAADKNAHSNDNETPAAVVAGPGPSTAPPVATPSPRRSSSAVALKRSLNQAIAKEKDLAPCRYKG